MATSFVLATSCLLAYLICYQYAVLFMRDDYLTGSESIIHFLVHYLLSALLLAMVALCGLLLHKFYAITTPVFKTFLWVSSFVVLFLLSTELQNTLVSILYSGGGWEEINSLEAGIFQIGYPILWGLCSFLVMYIGMAKKIKTYRIISLVVFSITLLKLFIVDVTRMSEGGKIAAFISLGVLLLIISFMYQKLKKIIIEDDKKVIKSLFVGLVCVGSGSVQAQDYNWFAPLDSVAQDGFYKLILKPEVTGRLVTDNYSDLRIYDQNNKAVPYLLQQEWNDDKKWFEEYTILSNEINPERFTKLVIHNPKKNSIDNFSLVVKNNNAYKLAKLSGSDDNQNWYFITDNYSLSMMQDQQGVVSEKRINFPLSNYEYYKLEINDSASAPLNILKIGYYTTSVETAKQILLTSPLITQADSLKSKQTFVEFSFNSNFHINTLVFAIDGPKFYKRRAILYKVERTSNGKIQLEEQHSFELRSDRTLIIPNPDIYGKDFLVVIDNGNNESLIIKSIQAFQTAHYLVAYLKSNLDYSLYMGYAKAEPPLYDLESFRDSISAVLPEIKPLRFEFVKKKEVKVVAVKEEWFKSKIWIWSALAAVIALLGFISYRMIKEMDKKENN